MLPEFLAEIEWVVDTDGFRRLLDQQGSGGEQVL